MYKPKWELNFISFHFHLLISQVEKQINTIITKKQIKKQKQR